MTLFTNTPQITGSEAEELFSAGISPLIPQHFDLTLFISS